MHRLQLSQLRGDSSLALTAVAVLLGLAAGGAVAWGTDHPEVSLTIAMFLVAIFPMVLRAIQGKWDPFEPITILAVCIFVIYFVRPMAELTSKPGDYLAFDRDPRPGYAGAMTIALSGSIALYAGYFLTTGKAIAQRVKALPQSWDVARSMRFVVYLLIFAALMTSVFAAAIGGPGALMRFYLGRSTQDFQQYIQTAAYFVLGPYMTIPAAIILYMAFLRERTLLRTVFFFAVLALVTFVVVPRGDRTYLIAIVMPLLIIPYLRREKRPSLLALLGAIGVGIIILNILIAIRHVDYRAQRGVEQTITESFTHPTREIEEFIKGVDIAEFTVMELQYIATSNGDLRLYPGATALSVITGPIPGKVIGKKPKPGAVHATDYLFPNNKRNAIFVPSLFGDLYQDWGIPTVVFYAFIFGIFMRFVWEYFLRNKHSEGMQIVYAASLPLLVILMRDNFSLTLGRALFLILPLILCLILCAKDRGGQAPAPAASG